ncbi:unnamed protein product [Durusdinium trenchii]|uniref:Inosine/uridine-preferring nucleoside hydrolase domain-containing protein n=1 Tax=Durusdinium trenchii TaxID=1381693 RepID=A0ABP0MR27_9DINO
MALAPHTESGGQRWLVVDTDAGVDDAFALCMALKLAEKSHFVLKLITCCFGNCSVEQVGMNVAKCLHACEVPPSLIRVVLGASGPLKQQEASNATHFHGNDGLGDATPPLDAAFLTAIGAVGFGAAVTALRELLAVAKKEGAEVTLVTLGPLTNLASALKEDAELPLLLHDLVVMGCCGNGRGNHGRVTEFNIHADPEAAAEVFARSWPQLTVSSWDLTVFATVPWPRFDQLLRSETQVGKFLAAISQLPYVQKRQTSSCSRGSHQSCWAFLASSVLELCAPVLRHVEHPAGTGFWQLQSQPGAIICDAITMAMVLQPEIILRSRLVHIEVELSGAITRGQTVVDWGTCFDGAHRPKHLRWVEEVDMELFYRMLRETMT